MTTMTDHVGIDIAADKLDVHVLDTHAPSVGKTFTIANRTTAILELTDRLGRQQTDVEQPIEKLSEREDVRYVESIKGVGRKTAADCRALADRLRHKGHAWPAVRGAVMRKLVQTFYGVLKNKTTWTSNYHLTANGSSSCLRGASSFALIRQHLRTHA